MPAINSLRKSKLFAIVAWVLQNTQNVIISREMYKDLWSTCTAIVLLIKTFVQQRSRCRNCRRGLLKFPRVSLFFHNWRYQSLRLTSYDVAKFVIAKRESTAPSHYHSLGTYNTSRSYQFQELSIRSVQLPYIPITAFAQTDLFWV